MSTITFQKPDTQGYYGQFGGAFIPEMLHRNVAELQARYLADHAGAFLSRKLRGIIERLCGPANAIVPWQKG